jgi:hypothetical protein
MGGGNQTRGESGGAIDSVFLIQKLDLFYFLTRKRHIRKRYF